jgi:hypothetical protein
MMNYKLVASGTIEIEINVRETMSLSASWLR